MARRFRHSSREEFEGVGDLVEGDTLLGRVRFHFVVTKKPSGIMTVKGSATPAPGSGVDFAAIVQRSAEVTLSFIGGTWDCWVTSVNLMSGSAKLLNRAGVHFDAEAD